MRNPITTKELYKSLIQMPDLHSIPELDGEFLVWKLYKNAYVRAYCDSCDTFVEIISTSAAFPSTHWHPNEDNMFDQLYLLGKKGNILVLKHSSLAVDMVCADIFYVGNPDQYRFNKNKKWHWGKLTYLEQK